MSPKSKSKSKPFRISLPATSANLGPAFDAAALAMDFYISLRAAAAQEFSIRAIGRDEEICGALPNHLILCTYREVLRSAGRDITPIALHIQNDIPIGKGCGSSAAARLAGIALANHFGRLGREQCQNHGGSPARQKEPRQGPGLLMGGLVVARMQTE